MTQAVEYETAGREAPESQRWGAILVAGLEGAALEQLESSLRSAGYAVSPSCDPAGAAKVASSGGVRAGIVNLGSESSVGYEILDAIRSVTPSETLPVVCLSHEVTDAHRRFLIELGADELLGNSADGRGLLETLDGLLSRSSDQTTMSGDLDVLPMIDVLQIFERQGQSGMLQVRGDGRTGTATISTGEIISASFAGLKGEEAAFALAGLRSGSFTFHSSASTGRVINEWSGSPIPFERLLMEAVRQGLPESPTTTPESPTAMSASPTAEQRPLETPATASVGSSAQEAREPIDPPVAEGAQPPVSPDPSPSEDSLMTPAHDPVDASDAPDLVVTPGSGPARRHTLSSLSLRIVVVAAAVVMTSAGLYLAFGDRLGILQLDESEQQVEKRLVMPQVAEAEEEQPATIETAIQASAAAMVQPDVVLGEASPSAPPSGQQSRVAQGWEPRAMVPSEKRKQPVDAAERPAVVAPDGRRVAPEGTGRFAVQDKVPDREERVAPEVEARASETHPPADREEPLLSAEVVESPTTPAVGQTVSSKLAGEPSVPEGTAETAGEPRVARPDVPTRSPARLVESPELKFPYAMRRRIAVDEIELRVLVDASGRVEQVVVVDEERLPGFAVAKAKKVAHRAQFEPARELNGAVSSWARLSLSID